MGVARLLAKGWIAFCVFAGAHAFANALGTQAPALEAAAGIGVCVLLFLAMGFLFIGGYGAAGLSGGLARLKPEHLAVGFDDLVFTIFAMASFAMQLSFAQHAVPGGLLGAMEAALRFGVPGQRALEEGLSYCSLDGGRSLASAFTWLLALIYIASALSRIRLAASIVRIERKAKPDLLGPTGIAFALGFVAVIGIQFLFIGTAFEIMPCNWLAGLFGQVLIGFGPLALAYAVVAAITNLLALGPEA